MLVPFGQDADKLQLAKAVNELEACNPVIGRYGLSLSSDDVQALVVGRVEALSVSERVEFGGGVTKELVLAFAGSPYVSQVTFAETVLELQDLFYEFKNESLEQIPDDELVATMRSLFDGVAEGDAARLAEALFDGLARTVREELVNPARPGFHDLTDADKADAGTRHDDAADPDEGQALKNGYTLAAHRYDVSKWVDDEFRPGWEGSSWLDE